MKENKRYLSLILILGLSLYMSGCSKIFGGSEDSAENPEEMSADTAQTDASEAPPEGTPTDVPPADAPAADVAAETPPPADVPPAEAPTPPPSDATAAAPAPSEPATPSAPTSSGEMADYSVKKGDTLMKIAFEVYGDIMKWKSIYEANTDKLKDANQLAVGTTLKYEKPASEPSIDKSGDSYLIKNGDTLGSISQEVYGTKSKWKKLWENNKTLIKDPNKIYAGFYLYYQITEEEKREAEKFKSESPQQLGSTEQPTETATAPATEAAAGATAAPVEQAPATPTTQTDTGADNGGLQSLISPDGSQRAPAGQN